MLGLAGQTLDAMMRANSLKALAGADVVIDVPLAEYGSLDWRRYKELIDEGYKAAEAMKERLLPLAVDDEAWQAWVSRAGRAAEDDAADAGRRYRWRARGSRTTRLMRQVLGRHVGQPLDVPALDADLTMLAGLDRYQSLTWEVAQAPRRRSARRAGAEKKYGPPFVYLG